jgi:hypothetical protein
MTDRIPNLLRVLRACSCLLVCAAVGCGGAPPGDPAPEPKTEVIQQKDGNEEVKTTVPH